MSPAPPGLSGDSEGGRRARLPAQGTVATRLPNQKPSFVVIEPVDLLWTDTGMGTLEQDPPGAGLRLLRHLPRQGRSPRPLAARQESNGVGPGEAPEGARSRRAPGPGSTSEGPATLERTAARPGLSASRPASAPLCHAHEGAEAEKGSPSNTASPMKSTFLSQPAGLAHACCFQVASHSLSP